jgi:hypothetical protein
MQQPRLLGKKIPFASVCVSTTLAKPLGFHFWTPYPLSSRGNDHSQGKGVGDSRNDGVKVSPSTVVLTPDVLEVFRASGTINARRVKTFLLPDERCNWHLQTSSPSATSGSWLGYGS